MPQYGIVIRLPKNPWNRVRTFLAEVFMTTAMVIVGKENVGILVSKSKDE